MFAHYILAQIQKGLCDTWFLEPPAEVTPWYANAQASRPRTVGERMTALGSRMVGRKVQINWKKDGGWWDAKVTQYNSIERKHRVNYSFQTDNVREKSPCRSVGPFPGPPAVPCPLTFHLAHRSVTIPFFSACSPLCTE